MNDGWSHFSQRATGRGSDFIHLELTVFIIFFSLELTVTHCLLCAVCGKSEVWLLVVARMGSMRDFILFCHNNPDKAFDWLSSYFSSSSFSLPPFPILYKTLDFLSLVIKLVLINLQTHLDIYVYSAYAFLDNDSLCLLCLCNVIIRPKERVVSMSGLNHG